VHPLRLQTSESELNLGSFARPSKSVRGLELESNSPLPKKPRRCKPFEFKPYTLQQYRETSPKQFKSLGKLGNPNIGSDLWNSKKAAKEKRLQYAKEVEANNRATMIVRPENERIEVPEITTAFIMRQRAVQFAKSIPKPKLKV
jgi:hypothetical protein